MKTSKIYIFLALFFLSGIFFISLLIPLSVFFPQGAVIRNSIEKFILPNPVRKDASIKPVPYFFADENQKCCMQTGIPSTRPYYQTEYVTFSKYMQAWALAQPIRCGIGDFVYFYSNYMKEKNPKPGDKITIFPAGAATFMQTMDIRILQKIESSYPMVFMENSNGIVICKLVGK